MKSVLERGLGRCFAPKAHGDFLGSGISATAFLVELLAERNTPKGVIFDVHDRACDGLPG